jgi:hypothetical protein
LVAHIDEESRLRVFPNRVLKGMFGTEKDEVTGNWRQIHNAELNDQHSPNMNRVVKSRMRWAVHIARMGEGTGVYKVFVGEPEGKRPLGRPRCRWEDNIQMDVH